jgi:hypothetical protein
MNSRIGTQMTQIFQNRNVEPNKFTQIEKISVRKKSAKICTVRRFDFVESTFCKLSITPTLSRQ